MNLARLLVLGTLGSALGLSTAHADDSILRAAAERELERALTMNLPGQPSPYFLAYEILDGDVATATAVLGQVTSVDHGPYRSLRAEVRVGDYSFDNANFDVSFGERDGVRVRGLPHEANETAIRRELWMATDAAYKGAAEQLSAKKAAREGRDQEHQPDLYTMEPLVTEPLARPTADGAWARHVAEALSARVGAHPDVEEGGAIVRDWHGRRLIVNTEGTRAWLPTGFSVVRVEVVMRASDGARLRNTRSWVARSAEDAPSLDAMLDEVDDMVDWTASLKDAPVEEDYLGPVVFEAPAAVELFRQLVLPEVAGTPPPERAPDPYGPPSDGPPTARIGRRLLPVGWTVVDDASAAPTLAGSYTHDFQGVAPQRVELVRDGVVKDVLMSRVPREGFTSSTGHGRALGADRREAIPSVVTISPRRTRAMGRLVRKASQLGRQADLDYVLVVKRIEPPALAEDFHMAFSGEGPLPGLTRPTEVVRRYADGREVPVRGAGFLGVDRRVLRDIALAGPSSNPTSVMDSAPGPGRFSVGTIGGLPTTWHVPAVLITELELRGSSGTEQRVIPRPPLQAAVTNETEAG